MESDIVTKFAVVLAVVAVVIGAVAVVLSVSGDGDTRYTIYIGMDPGAGTDETDDVESTVKDMLSGYGTGYTIFWADGAYSDDGETVETDTLVIVLLDAIRSQVDAVADAVADMDGVLSVTTESYNSGVSFS